MILPEPIQNLVNALARLPGIGPKTAEKVLGAVSGADLWPAVTAGLPVSVATILNEHVCRPAPGVNV